LACIFTYSSLISADFMLQYSITYCCYLKYEIISVNKIWTCLNYFGFVNSIRSIQLHRPKNSTHSMQFFSSEVIFAKAIFKSYMNCNTVCKYFSDFLHRVFLCARVLKSNVTQARLNYILLLSLRAGCCQLSPTPLKHNFTLFAIALHA
jgi:hypothetical protein